MNDGTTNSDKECVRKIIRSVWDTIVESSMPLHAKAGGGLRCPLHDEGRKRVVGAVVRRERGYPRTWSGPGLLSWPSGEGRHWRSPSTRCKASLHPRLSGHTSAPVSACHESDTDSLHGAGDLSVSGKR